MTGSTARTRAIEWWLAGCTAGLGAWLTASPESMDGPAFEVLVAWMPEAVWASLFLFAGLAHILALIINGRAVWTPLVRCLTTSLCVFLYAAYAFGFWNLDRSTTAVFSYGFGFGGGALWCFSRAVRDVVRGTSHVAGH